MSGRLAGRVLLACAAGLLSGLLLPAAFGAQPKAQARTLHIAAAADLEPVLPAVLARFQQQTGVHATVSYQSSATLAQQIIDGAPYDLFFAADMGFAQRVASFGMATEKAPSPYARGTLVLWARRDAPILHGQALTFDVLGYPGLSSVAIANPQTAPYGRAAQTAIENMHLESTLKPKLRIASNIAQAAQYADSGNAEVGMLSLTSALTPKLSADGSYLLVDPALYPPIVQGVVVLRHAADPADAQRLLNFMQTPAMQAQLVSFGLKPPA